MLSGLSALARGACSQYSLYPVAVIRPNLLLFQSCQVESCMPQMQFGRQRRRKCHRLYVLQTAGSVPFASRQCILAAIEGSRH